MKHAWIITVLSVAAGAASLCGQATRPAADVSSIAGDYAILSAVKNEAVSRSDKLATHSVRIGDGRFALLGPSADTFDAVVTGIDASASPMQIDLAIPDPNRGGEPVVVHAIYAVVGEVLTVSIPTEHGRPRPSDLAGGAGRVVLILKRNAAATGLPTTP